MKRILQVIKGLDRGGAERLLVDMLRYRDAAAFDYEVAYLLRGSDAMVPSIEELDVPVRCLDAGRGPGWVRRLKTLVSERSIDLVHVHSPFAAIGARLSLRGSEPRMVYTEHSAWEGYRPATRWGNLVTYPRNDHVFAVSGHVSAVGPLSVGALASEDAGGRDASSRYRSDGGHPPGLPSRRRAR